MTNLHRKMSLHFFKYNKQWVTLHWIVTFVLRGQIDHGYWSNWQLRFISLICFGFLIHFIYVCVFTLLETFHYISDIHAHVHTCICRLTHTHACWHFQPYLTIFTQMHTQPKYFRKQAMSCIFLSIYMNTKLRINLVKFVYILTSR